MQDWSVLLGCDFSASQNRIKFEDGVFVDFRVCLVCQSREERIIAEMPNFVFFCDSELNQVFQIRITQCKRCGLVQNNPVWDLAEFANVAKRAGRSYGADPKNIQAQKLFMIQNNLLRSDMKLLDIGAYDGSFLRTLPSSMKRVGIDPDARAVADGNLLSSNLDSYELICTPFESIQLEEQFDIFTMFHVLEHLVNPIEVLLRLAEMAHEETQLLVEVPVIELANSLDIGGFFVPLHLTHFSKSTLINMLAKTGWRVTFFEDAVNYNGFRVIAIPSAKLNLDVDAEKEFIKVDKLRRVEIQNINRISQLLSDVPQTQELVIWGAGLHLELLWQHFSFVFANRRLIVWDSDPKKIGSSWRGHIIMKPNFESLDAGRSHYFVISSYGYQQEILFELRANGISEDDVLCLYDVIISY